MPLKVSDGIGAWIKDFKKSDAPQFKGKSADERRDMALAAYLSAKRGDNKEEVVRNEAMSAKQKADMDRAMKAFKARGGKVKKLPPGKAQGYHGKDDPGKGVTGGLGRDDTKAFGTRKKVRSMRRESIEEAMDPKMRKVKQLANLGLVGKADVMKLMQAMKSIGDGKEVKPQNRKIIFNAFADLIDLVTGDTTVFQKAKKAVREETFINEAIKYTHAAVDRLGKVIGMASKESDAKDMARRHKGKVVKLKKPMAPRTGDMMINRPFKEAIDPSDTGGSEEISMAMRQLEAMDHFIDGIEDRLKSTGDMEEWYQNKLTKAHDYLKTLYAYGKGDSND